MRLLTKLTTLWSGKGISEVLYVQLFYSFVLQLAPVVTPDSPELGTLCGSLKYVTNFVCQILVVLVFSINIAADSAVGRSGPVTERTRRSGPGTITDCMKHCSQGTLKS